MKYACNTLLGTLFTIGLWLPLADTLFHFDTTPPPDETRQLAAAPALPSTLDSWRQFPRACEAYVNDHFGCRAFLSKSYCRLKAGVLGVSSTSSVLIGKQGWVYLGITDEVASCRVNSPLSEADCENILDRYAKWQKTIAPWAGKMMVVIAPNKSTMYPEYLPGWLTRLDTVSDLDRLDAFMAEHPSIPFLNLTDTMLRARQLERMYYKADAHWNDLGAYYGYLAMIQAASAQFPGLKPLPPEQVQFKYARSGAKHEAVMMNVPEYYTEPEIAGGVRNRKSHYVKNGIPDLHIPPSNWLTIFEKKDPALPTAVVLHDSFGYALMPYLAESFRRIVFLREQNTSFEAIMQREKPDFFVFVNVERQLQHSRTGSDGTMPPIPMTPGILPKTAEDSLVASEALPLPKIPVLPYEITWGENVLRNGEFHSWAKDLPEGWKTAPEKTPAGTVTKGNDGSGIALSASKDIYLKQIVPAATVKLGAPLSFGGAVNVRANNQVSLIVSYWVGSTERKEYIYVKGANDWQEISNQFMLPAEADPDRVTFYLRRKPGVDGDVFVSRVFVKFAE